jgi:hypothetical protein
MMQNDFRNKLIHCYVNDLSTFSHAKFTSALCFTDEETGTQNC